MKELTSATLIRGYCILGAILFLVFLGRVVFGGLQHIDASQLREGMLSGKKPVLEPSVQEKIARGSKLYRTVMLCWAIGFFLLLVYVRNRS